MVNEKLLKEKLDFISDGRSNEFQTIKFTKDIIPKLLEEFDNYNMAEYYYCCHGLTKCCWTGIYAEGICGYTKNDIKDSILDNITWIKKYLYNGKKYGGNRLHIYKNNNEVCIYIYLRDIIKMDIAICFYNK